MHPGDRGVIKRSLGVILALALIFGLKSYNTHYGEAGVREQVKELITTLPHYGDEPVYIESLFDRAHERATEAAYSLASDHKTSRFNSNKYIQIVFQTMVEDAQLDGRGELANEIQARRALVISDSEQEKS